MSAVVKLFQKSLGLSRRTNGNPLTTRRNDLLPIDSGLLAGGEK